MAASIAGFIASAGGSSLISAWALAVGINVLEMAVTAGMGSFFALVAGTGLSLWGG